MLALSANAKSFISWIANLDIILDLIYDHATEIKIYFSIEIF